MRNISIVLQAITNLIREKHLHKVLYTKRQHAITVGEIKMDLLKWIRYYSRWMKD